MAKSNPLIIDKQEVVKSINAYLLDKLPLDEKHQESTCNPTDLLCAARFDVIVKYIYALHHDIGASTNWASEMYSQHLKAFGGFIEGDYSGKRSLEAYKHCFANILDAIADQGFDKKKGLVPIDNNSVIIDGAHRLSACLYYKKPISCVTFNHEANIYDYEYFLTRGFKHDFADSVALQYCKINPKTFIAVLFPVAKGNDSKVINLIKDVGDIFYIKDVSFTRIGRQNLIQQLYKGETWLGENGKITKGLIHHVENRFLGNKPVRFIVFESADKKNVAKVKENIREIFRLKNDSIHINDSHEGTVRIAEQIFNANSIHFLNHALPWKSKKFISMFQDYKDLVISHDKDSYCIDSGGVLAAYGLRDTNDIDYLFFKEPISSGHHSYINSHNEQLIFHSKELGDLIYDPINIFYYDGIKFLTLHTVKAMKIKRNETKDIRDIALIDTVSNGVSKIYITINEIRYLARVLISKVKEFRMWKLKYLLPKSFHPVAYKLYNAPFFIKEAFGPQNRTIIYKNFTLNYSRGTSLIHRIIRGKTYEPTFTTQILKSLSSNQSPVFIDIGANIGLISLNILASMSFARIFAFEPGPHQFEMFSKTISDNNLTEKIILYNEALSYEEGAAEFSTHNTKHASGDGFFDTGRAGNSDIIKVKCNTLDRWWAAENKIGVNVVKIDSEGAELWILKGANKLIGECRPTIFFEFNRVNNTPYPYDEYDILSYFEKKDYTVKTIIGEPVTKTNIKQITESQDDFIAVPK